MPADSYPAAAFPAMQREAARMNALERAYRDVLIALRLEREIAWFAYESIKLRIGEKCFYTPDFSVVTVAGVTEMHEVKGPYFREDARVKLKGTAAIFPHWRFLLVERKTSGRGWKWTDYSAQVDRR